MKYNKKIQKLKEKKNQHELSKEGETDHKKIEISFNNTGLKLIAEGNSGFQIRNPLLKIGENIIIASNAKELFDFKIERVKILLKYIKKGDFLFETTVCRQIIVMLVSAFEVYVRTRFLEIENEGKELNLERVYDSFLPDGIKEKVKVIIASEAKKKGSSELELFIKNRNINFQNWSSFKKAYNKGYNLKIGEIGLSNIIIIKIQKFIKWRHIIIHSKLDSPTINFEYCPPEEPVITNQELARKGINLFQKFINKFHEATNNLI